MSRAAGVFRFLVGCALGVAPALACSAAQVPDSPPSYATGGDEAIHGTISALLGKYTLTLADDRGFSDSVTLHEATLISPAGSALVAGAVVTIVGHSDGKTFDADEIDFDGGEPYDSGPAASYFSGDYVAGLSPPYIVPLGGGGYYYGNAFGYGAASYGNFGGYYYSGPSGSSGRGGVTQPAPPVVPVHRTPISHPPIPRINPPAAPSRASSPSGRR